MQLFYEVFEALPRQGPGSRVCTKRALDMCVGLPPTPAILDLGCGVGAQTLDLAALTNGTIVAVDLHEPNIARLQDTIEHDEGLAHRITPRVADFGNLDHDDATFDLVWSEGALYNLGLERALPLCKHLLRPGGHLAFTDAIWRTDNPPAQVRALFEEDYPTMGRVPDVLAQLEAIGLTVAGHFTLPDAAWWDDFYTPMNQRIAELRDLYAGDREALAALDELAEEPKMHEQHGAHYGYEFFVCRRPSV
jgi:SAM-dependent methyltransferase